MIKPIALTSGDPNGVGLDLSFVAARKLNGTVPFFLIADATHLNVRGPKGGYKIIDDPSEVSTVENGILPVLHHPFPQQPLLNGMQLENAGAIIDVITRAVNLVQSNKASAICTNPIHKKVLQDGAGFSFPGHTEFLAHLASQNSSVMMLACDELRVVPVTIHIALDAVATQLTPELLLYTIETTHQSLIDDFGIEHPRIAIAGLNPHAGEQGAFGREEIEIVTPILDRLRGSGINIQGPMSADTMFHSQARARYDVAICMYHDQALIPIKTIDFFGGVNITLGLPFIRTSPDHGTAFDLAGGTDANPDSLIAALRSAYGMVKARAKNGK
jgi:4-hydroxythreonine-4-phosphate dehydrogenase